MFVAIFLMNRGSEKKISCWSGCHIDLYSSRKVERRKVERRKSSCFAIYNYKKSVWLYWKKKKEKTFADD